MPTDELPRIGRGAPRRWTLLFAVMAVVLGLVAGPAAGQTEPERPKTEQEQADADEVLAETLELAPDEPPSPDDPFVEVVATALVLEERAIERLEATAQSDAANIEALGAVDRLNQSKLKEAEAVSVRQDAIAELEVEGERLSDLTVRAYVTGGTVDVEKYQAFLDGDTTDPEAGRQIMFGQVLLRQKQVTEAADEALRKARAKLSDIREVVAANQAESDRRLATAEDLANRRTNAEAAHATAVADADAADRRLRNAPRSSGEGVSVDAAIIGMPRLSAEDLATWFATTAYRPRVATPIEDYARWFIAEGAAEGIRGDIAFAQAVLETGGFANNDSVNANNFSGIGHCDSCATGWTFGSPQLGVRAQIQLLKSYAVRRPDYANDLVDSRLRGPAGCCETWGDLTTVWATDPTYGPKVMLIYTSIVDHALARRARGEGFDDPVGRPSP